MYNRLVKNVS